MSKKKHVEDWNWHHRKPKKLGGSGKVDGPNMSHVPIIKHRAWHTLFETKAPTEIARVINETWLDPEWEMVAVKKEKPT